MFRGGKFKREAIMTEDGRIFVPLEQYESHLYGTNANRIAIKTHGSRSLLVNGIRAIIPEVSKIYYDEKKGTTVVLWADGTKTIVKKSDDVEFDLYTAVSAAIAEKKYGSNSAFKRMIREKAIDQNAKRRKKNGK